MASKVRKNKHSFMHSLWIKIVVGLIVLIICDACWYFFIVNVGQYKDNNPVKTAFMKYREHQWAKKHLNKTIKQVWVPLNSISPEMRKAVVVSEDAKFWMHDGFDFDAMRKAIEKNIKKRKMAVGASTITMQLAKNLYLSPIKTPIRKINEAILTLRIEKTLSKKRILELYLNVAEWGDGIFGIEMASRTYFHHSAASLSRYEASLLAAVLPNPIRFNPLKNSRFVMRRSRLIRRAMGGDIEAAMALQSPQMRDSTGNQKENDNSPMDILPASDTLPTKSSIDDSSKAKNGPQPYNTSDTLKDNNFGE